jgi:hypothetical protein
VSVRSGDGTIDLVEVVPPNRGAQSGAAFAQSLATKSR